MSSPNARLVGVITIVMTLLGWSSIPLFLRHFAESIDPWTSNGWRYGFSALLWAPVLVVGLARRSLPRNLWRSSLVPAIINAGSQTLFCWAHYKVEPGLLSFGLRANIVFSTVGAAIFFAAERKVIRSPGYLIGLLMVVGGTLGTMLMGEEPLRGASLTGVLLAVASGAGFAAYALAVRHWMHGVPAIPSFAAISLVSAVPMVVLMLAYGDARPGETHRSGSSAPIHVVTSSAPREEAIAASGVMAEASAASAPPTTSHVAEFRGASVLDLIGRPVTHNGAPVVVRVLGMNWGIDQFVLLLISAVIGIALGHVFYYHSINILGLAVSAAVVQLQPVFVSIGSLYLFGERLTTPQWLSGAVAVSGAVGILWAQQRLTRRGRETVARARSGSKRLYARAARGGH